MGIFGRAAMQIAMIQDRLVPVDELDPAYLDRGLYFGDGVYEVVRSYNGRIFALEEHLQRFARSTEAIRIKGERRRDGSQRTMDGRDTQICLWKSLTAIWGTSFSGVRNLTRVR